MTDDLVIDLRLNAEHQLLVIEDYRRAADCIEKLEAANLKQSLIKVDDELRIEKLEAVTKDDAKWLAAYHKWCEMNGCAPSSSDLISARNALERKDDAYD